MIHKIVIVVSTAEKNGRLASMMKSARNSKVGQDRKAKADAADSALC